MKKVAMTFAATLMVASGALYANPVTDLIKSLDTDGDGQISQQEAAANPELQAQFAALDANQDGYLTSDELTVESQSQQDPQG